jgi:hypothetical protein
VVKALKTVYRDFTADVYWDAKKQEWQVVEINSPIFLKAGIYLLDYQFPSVRDRLHEEKSYAICTYTNTETKEIVELKQEINQTL